MAVHFYEENIASGLKGKRRLSAFLQALVQEHRKEITKISLQYIFCSDDYLLSINKQFLNHDTFTDIITFDLSEEPDTLSGEIYISIGRIRENAKKFNASYVEELHRVIFHGALHLCGFKDKKPADKKEMTHQEDLCIKDYFESR